MYHYSYPTIWGPTITALYDTASDLRFKHFFNKTTTGPGYTFAGTLKKYSDAFYYLQVGLSVPEMYLTRAEANARLGNKAAAIDDLNTIRKNRYLTAAFVNLDQSAYTQAQVLELVKEERRRELWGKGLRWFDLKRYNALDNAGISITRFFSGDKLMPSDKEWVLPIGELYISMNPEIIQN
jgi:starch-binding outer membrane protein, SusD/RagB family